MSRQTVPPVRQSFQPECRERCCGSGTPPSAERIDGPMFRRYDGCVSGRIDTPAGEIPRVITRLRFADRLGAWKVRWGIGRMSYSIRPGLCAMGEPDSSSPVFVSANYKMSFDLLRRSLCGINGWILVLDTKGINVWCAAGRGSFGTDEVVRRVEETQLARIVSHRTLILPQLSAPGVVAREVEQKCGFQVLFGPIRAHDIREFMGADMKAAPGMRRVRFDFRDRVALAPVEMVVVLRHPAFRVFLLLWILGNAGIRPLSVDGTAVFGAILIGTVAVPALLPWIPGRALSWKGWFLGALWAAAVCGYRGLPNNSAPGWAAAFSLWFLLPALSGFLAMNFTGSTTYTSLSGVVKEMKIALPLIIFSAIAGIAAIVASAWLQP